MKQAIRRISAARTSQAEAQAPAISPQEAKFVREALTNVSHDVLDLQYENEALRKDDVLCLRLALAARDALKEAEAILGGEYGDQYSVLMENIRELDAQLAGFPTPAQAEAQAPTTAAQASVLTEAVYAWVREDLSTGAQMQIGFFVQKLIDRLTGAPAPAPTKAQVNEAATRVWEIAKHQAPIEPGTDHERIVRVIEGLLAKGDTP